jgi:DNA-binding response OmpR family regulator
VWGMEYTATSRTIDVHVDQLRRKLGKRGDWIKSLKGIGYRFEED